MSRITKNLLIIIGGILLAAILFIPLIFLRSKPIDVSQEQEILQEIATENLVEAKYYNQLAGGIVRCNLCPQRCTIQPGSRGICRTRENEDGKLYTLVYGLPVSKNVDPIEKKPIFHLLPGTAAFSIATAGCNFSCLNCQNWQISQATPEDFNVEYMSPEEIVQAAIKSGSKSIAYTYSEPVIFYEYMYDTAKLAHEQGLKNIMVTNGYINQEPLLNLLPHMDAFNVDLKFFNDEGYQKITGGTLEPVLQTLKTIKEYGALLEITNLIIPGENDSEDEIRAMCKWLYENLGQDAILHFSAFHPDYKLRNLPPTPIETLTRAREIAVEQGLKYVYIGNVYIEGAETTFCADGSVAIKRQGFFVTENNLEKGKCADGTEIPGVWE